MAHAKHHFAGRVWKFGDDIRGDSGILDFALIRDHSKPFDEKELAANCFKKLRPEFGEQVNDGDIIVAGRGFANYNHPQVSLAIKAGTSSDRRSTRRPFNKSARPRSPSCRPSGVCDSISASVYISSRSPGAKVMSICW